jgi:hypothetical protein
LFQERCKSEVVENEAYLITVLRYIHQNPIKAGITNSVAGYKWSSYHEYIRMQNIIDTEFILELFTAEKQIAKKEFEKYMHEVNEDIFLGYKERHRIADDEIIKLIEEKYGVNKVFFHLLGRQRNGYDTEKFKGNKRCYNKTACKSNRGKQVYG